MSAIGPSRQFAVTLELGRFRGEADVDRSSLLANRDANDLGCVKTLRGIIAPGIWALW